MDATTFLAQFWGWFSVITAVIYLARGRSFMDELLGMHDDKAFVFLSGWVLLPLGLITIIFHNVWVADWRVIITMAGWASALMGAMRIGLPEITRKMTSGVFRGKIARFRMAVGATGILGAWLIYMSL